jgi:hypothetical protein
MQGLGKNQLRVNQEEYDVTFIILIPKLARKEF